jgi:hypothetical protein
MTNIILVSQRDGWTFHHLSEKWRALCGSGTADPLKILAECLKVIRLSH